MVIIAHDKTIHILVFSLAFILQWPNTTWNQIVEIYIKLIAWKLIQLGNSDKKMKFTSTNLMRAMMKRHKVLSTKWTN